MELSEHSAYSDPLGHAGLLDDVPTDLDALSAVARNVIVHYRGSGLTLPEATRGDVHSRWLSALLDADQARHGTPLAEPREATARVQGCCRDHSLFCVGVLRQHGIPARTRVGFAGYLGGPWFIRNYVLLEVAHRHRDELLLWDGWGAMSMPGAAQDGTDAALLDEVAAMLVAADRDRAAERALADRYAADDRLHPGTHVRRFSPYDEPPVIEQIGPRTAA